MTIDNGAAALAERLHGRLSQCLDTADPLCFACNDVAYQALANGAVFLPDGREVERLIAERDAIADDEQSAQEQVDRLTLAVDGLEDLWLAMTYTNPNGRQDAFNQGVRQTLDRAMATLRAALEGGSE
jgi:hypothetical protein